MAFPVLSTYRLQMRGDCFTFDDAIAVLDYLDELGVSHLYLSPILTAAEGSMVTAATLDRSVMTSSAGESSVTGFGAGCARAQAPLAASEMEARGW